MVDFNQAVKDQNGKAIKAEEEDDLRLGNVVCNALYAQLEGDKADGNEKIRRHNLASKIQGDGEDFCEVELTHKQETRILDMADKVFGALIYSRIYEAVKGNLEVEDE